MPRRGRIRHSPYSRGELFAVGPPPALTGERLSQVAFPLGGIGTGTISLGGSAELRDFEIFNRPNKDTVAGMHFFALWVRAGKDAPVVKVLETAPQPPYAGPHGYRYSRLAGLPRMKSLEFQGEYPIAQVRFRDNDLPVRVELTAYTPMIPLDSEDSGLPSAVFLWKLSNPGRRRVEVSLAANFTNLVGYDAEHVVNHKTCPSFGGNVTEFRRGRGLAGLTMRSTKHKPEDALYGTMAVMTPWKRLSWLAAWPRGAWWDDVHLWWNQFSARGRFKDEDRSTPSREGRTDVGSLALRATLGPGESVTLPVVLAWYFPNRIVSARGLSPEPAHLRNYYAKRYRSAWDVGAYVIRNLQRLDASTRDFHRALYSSTLPTVVLDAAGSQMSTMRTNTCFRTADGVFHAYEGCSAREGCCPMNCTHVWNYEQALAFLFPDLERTMRQTDFLTNTRPSGEMAFRTALPLGSPLWKHRAAADGQMGCILKLYREWRLSGDTDWLRGLWPRARKTLEFAWKEWDRDRDGVMEGVQHNTYDIEFLGPNAMMGTLYLAALQAGAVMAAALGEIHAAAEYRAVALKGAVRLEHQLFNGEFYVQKYDPRKAPKYQFGKGCLADQLLGQWFAMVVGLAHLLPPAHVRRTLQSIFRYNWRPDLSRHANVQRVYALGDEPGLLLCTWPRGGRSAIPFPYSDEVWTGIEYQVAAHMLYENMLVEGLTVVKGARSRHDGRRRNPWNEPECGDHYARAMSSWSLILALSGFDYSAPEHHICFAPKVSQDDFRCLFSAGSAWGTYWQKLVPGKRLSAAIVPHQGSLKLKTLALQPQGRLLRVRVSQSGRHLRAWAESYADLTRVVLKSPATVTPQAPLRVLMQLG